MTFLGDEFMFRGMLLPKIEGGFGKSEMGCVKDIKPLQPEAFERLLTHPKQVFKPARWKCFPRQS